MTDPQSNVLERFIRTDPARRGLISTEAQFGPLLPGHLGFAAQDLARSATSVAIVTGFYIPSAEPPAAETDGPLGAVVLAETLRQLGIESRIVTDEFCRTAVQAAARFVSYPLESTYIADLGHPPELPNFHGLSHLISIERVGPNHTFASIRQSEPNRPDVWKQFDEAVAWDNQNRCCNMRGQCIDDWTVPLHSLFEQAATVTPRIHTIGLGDGGNEIGMGSIPWSELVRRLPEPCGAQIACRIPCDWTILAGVSNWAGYALAAAVASLRGRVEILEPWTCQQQFEWLEALVQTGPAVDGVTRLPQPTVDGLPFATYIQPWDAIRQSLGLRR